MVERREQNVEQRLDEETSAYVDAVADRLRAALDSDLVGLYLHGSAAFGDFNRRRSDVDIVAVTSRALSREEKETIATLLSQRSLPCPAEGLELHIVEARTLRIPTDAPPFELQVDSKRSGTARTVDGAKHPGDRDLVMHYAVLREHGRALFGPPPSELFPQIPRAELLRAFVYELDWAEQNGSPAYQVLNACRASRYLEEGLLGSKTGGGEWARSRAGDPSAIDAALRQRSGSDEAVPDPNEARALLNDVRRRLKQATNQAR